MDEGSSRRERKKAATRQHIADTARTLFLERGYRDVGIRDIATEADVAVTTLFAHFPSKEALVFELDEDFEAQLVRAAEEHGSDEPLVDALRRQVKTMLRHCTSAAAAPLWELIDSSPELRAYEDAMRARHAEALADAIARTEGLPRTTTACRALARFVVDAFVVSRTARRPLAAADETFLMIAAAWQVRVG